MQTQKPLRRRNRGVPHSRLSPKSSAALGLTEDRKHRASRSRLQPPGSIYEAVAVRKAASWSDISAASAAGATDRPQNDSPPQPLRW